MAEEAEARLDEGETEVEYKGYEFCFADGNYYRTLKTIKQ